MLIHQKKKNRIGTFVFKNKVLDAEIWWTLKCIKSHYSYKSCEDIAPLLSKMFTDSGFSCGEKSVRIICHFGLGPNFQTFLLDNYKNAEYFTLLFDEILNQTNQKK